MPDRYFVETPIEGDRAALGDAEAHHLAHVMRAKPGLEVVLFDGSGQEFSARVEKVGRSNIELAIISRAAVDRELPIAITLAVALPKQDRQRWLVEKAVELGVARLVPLVTTRGVAQAGPGALTRLRRTVIEASKQCGRNRLMEIAEPQTLPELIDQPSDGLLRLIAHPGGSALRSFLTEPALSGSAANGVIAAIGPEGGFDENEVASAVARGWLPVGLGKRILRVETAALQLAAAVAAWVPEG